MKVTFLYKIQKIITLTQRYFFEILNAYKQSLIKSNKIFTKLWMFIFSTALQIAISQTYIIKYSGIFFFFFFLKVLNIVVHQYNWATRQNCGQYWKNFSNTVVRSFIQIALLINKYYYNTAFYLQNLLELLKLFLNIYKYLLVWKTHGNIHNFTKIKIKNYIALQWTIG